MIVDRSNYKKIYIDFKDGMKDLKYYTSDERKITYINKAMVGSLGNRPEYAIAHVLKF